MWFVFEKNGDFYVGERAGNDEITSDVNNAKLFRATYRKRELQIEPASDLPYGDDWQPHAIEVKLK